MLDDTKQLIADNPYLNQRKEKKQADSLKRKKNILFVLAIVASLVLCALFYFLSPVSGIYRVVVEDNENIKDEDIVELSQMKSDDKLLLTLPSVIEKRILTCPFIEDAKVTLKNNRLVAISIQEKKIIGYTYQEDKNVYILADESMVDIDTDNMYLLNCVPLIEGFLGDDLLALIKQLKTIDSRLINEISEIHNYPALRFQNIELIMRDGNYIFTSLQGMNMLKNYFEINSKHGSSDKNCYYFEDISGNAYTSPCPWAIKNDDF